MRPAAGVLVDRFGIETGAPRRGVEIGRQGQAHAHQQRTQGYQGPVREDALCPGSRRGDAPQRVQLILDRDQQQNAGAGDADDAHRGRLRCRTGEILEPPGGLLADCRHEVVEYRREKLLARPGEIREGRQDAERDDAERHQRDECRIAQRAGRGEAAIPVEPVHGVSRKRPDRGEPLPQRADSSLPIVLGPFHQDPIRPISLN